MSLDPQWVNLALLALLLVAQVGRWTKRAEEKTGIDSIRVGLDSVFVPRELYESELAAAVERIRKLENRVNGKKSSNEI